MKEGLIYISDRLGQLRYSDGNEKSRWLQPLSSYKALKTIKRGQAVSVATEAEIKSVLTEEQYATYKSDPSPYIVPTNTKIHNRCIGLALENAELDGEVHILSSGQFEYDGTGISGKEYDPKFTTEEISKKVYVSDKEGELTTSSEVAYENYNNIIQIGHIIDAPNSTKNDQNKTILEVQIQGDDRGILESTQFEAVLGEDVYINKDEPLTVFAFGQEEATKFKLKLCTRNMEADKLSSKKLKASFIVIKKLSGEYSLIKFSDEEIESDDITDINTLTLLRSRYTPKKETTITNIDFSKSASSIDTIISAFNDAIIEMGTDLVFNEIESSREEDFSSVTLELSQAGGYYDIYISNSLRDFLRDTTTLQNGSLLNKNKAVLADIRIDARRNIFGVLVNDFKENTKLEEGSRILLMRQGELVVNSRELTDVGKKFVLGESGAVICADDALRTADSSNTIGYLKKVHGDHYHFVIDIGENIPKVEYSTYPVGYLKPYYGDPEIGKETPDFGYLLTDREYQINDYKELYERLLGWYDETTINRNNGFFYIPLITDINKKPMQIKYVTDGIFERLPKVPYLRDFGNISETEDHACGINKLDITALLSINTTFSEVDTLPLENLDIHLYIDPGYTGGEHNWREVRPGFYKYNNVDTYGFEWKIEKSAATEKDIYGKYILSADIGEDGRGIYYVSSDNVAPISCFGVPYKLYVAVKQTNIEHFDLRNLMSNYISNTIYNKNNNNAIDDIYAVTGEAVVNAIRNNEWFNILRNTDKDATIDFGGTIKLEKDVNIHTDKAIRLNCKVVSEEPEETQRNAVLIGETEDNEKTYTTLEIKEGKAFLNKVNTHLFAYQGAEFVNAGNEVATIDDVLDHALMSIDNDENTVKNAIIQNSPIGRIHGMKFGKDGNVNASKLCDFEVGIAHGQSWENISEALIPIIYKSGNDVHTPLQGHLDYYTNPVNDNETTKLFTLYPSYKTDEEVLDLEFRKNETNIIDKISFGNAKLIALTEAPSLSKYKTIYSENKLDREGQFDDNRIDPNSKPDEDDNVSFDFAYILQAAYELPMAYWKYRDSNEYNIGPIIERLQDTINYFEKEKDITYKVDGDKEAYKYTDKQRTGIAKSLKDIISESGKSVRVDDMVGFLLAAAGETQKRLAKLERSTYGRDVMDETKIDFINMPEVNSEHTYYGLNRLVRAICLELFGKANPDPEKLVADKDTRTSLSRMDDIERQIRGSKNTPDAENGSIANNSINDFGNASAEGYSISSSYPYKEDIENNLEFIEDEDDILIGDNSITNTKETIFGDTKAKDTDSFNGVVDAIYRITQKVDVLTEAINGTNDILQPHTTLNKIKRNIETLIKEVYFDGAIEGETAYKDELGKGELFDKDGTTTSRVDEITNALYNNALEYKNWTTDENGTLTETRDGTEGPTLSGYEGANYNNGKLTIEPPKNITEYENINIIDIILKAIGNQIILKHYNDQHSSAQEKRFNKDISQRLYKIEQCLDKVVLRLKDSPNFEDFTEIDFNYDETTTLNLDEFSEALSKLLGYKYYKKDGAADGGFWPTEGVNPNDESNSNRFSAEYALRTKSNIVAGLENLLYRVQNEEKDNLHVRSVLGDELMKGVTVSTTEAGNEEQDTQKPNVTESFTLSDDIKDLLATIYGEVQSNLPDNNQIAADDNNTTYYRHRTKARVTTDGGSFLNGSNIIEDIVNELYYIPQPLNNNLEPIYHENLINDTIYVNHNNNNVDSSFFTGSLINGINREHNFEPITDGGRMSRLDILESDVRALRNFIGLAGILSSDNPELSTTDKKKVAIDGDFSFSKNNDNGQYFVNDGSYEIGANSSLKTSFIESFFNLMKRVDNVENINTLQNNKLNEKFNTSDIITEDSNTDPTDNNVFSASKVDSLFNSSNSNVDSLNTRITDATERLTDVEEEINSFAIATSSLKVEKAQNILADFTVTGTQNFVISAPEGKNYHCKVSFILDPKCEYIGSTNKDKDGKIIRKGKINSAIKDVEPLCKYDYEDLPRWESEEEAKNDTNAYVVYNKRFSNMFSLYPPSALNMEAELLNAKGIYCGVSQDDNKLTNIIGCLPHIKKVGCLMSDLIIYDNNSNTTTATQYTPFYFELIYVPRSNNSTIGDWKFSWHVNSDTENK